MIAGSPSSNTLFLVDPRTYGLNGKSFVDILSRIVLQKTKQTSFNHHNDVTIEAIIEKIVQEFGLR